MKNFLFLLILALFAVACSPEDSTNKNSNVDMENSYSNLVQISPPAGSNAAFSKVYIDSVEIINYESEHAVLISGNFANGCTKLKSVGHTINNGRLKIALEAWQPADKMCTQALTPFSFIYDELSRKQLSNRDSLWINEKQFDIKLP